ncbi:MAG: AbrB/MazE/SpoVT family DNA-binding domain-containing protein [Ancalomicrobiaceae bacterium]|nr:AbrB/MazE/SpoVT family DNA-binding domain-containing protein [Ancalomicrobiaceae bacterium]
MQVQVKKWGNSASLRLPSAVMRAANLKIDQLVDIREEDGRIVIEPVRRPEESLDALIAGITADNMHGEVSTGQPVGAEVW